MLKVQLVCENEIAIRLRKVDLLDAMAGHGPITAASARAGPHVSWQRLVANGKAMGRVAGLTSH
jgi:hypothetical protein